MRNQQACLQCGTVRNVEHTRNELCGVCWQADEGAPPPGWLVLERRGALHEVACTDETGRARSVLLRAQSVGDAVADASAYACLVCWDLVVGGGLTVRLATLDVVGDFRKVEAMTRERAPSLAKVFG